MQCRAPPKVCALYLKQQHLCFKLTHIVRDLSPSLENPQEFYHVYQSFPTTIRNLLCELYLHNYVVPFDIEWNPMLNIKHIHLKALMSWIQNEISMGNSLGHTRIWSLIFNYRLELRPKILSSCTMNGRDCCTNIKIKDEFCH